MFKKMKNIAIAIIVLLLFISIFTVSIPKSSAKFFKDTYACKAMIEVSYSKEAANDPILPFDMVKIIPVTIYYKVKGVYAEEITLDYQDIIVPIYLEIEETPEWCSASINPTAPTVNPSSEWITIKADLSVKVYEDAHAFSEGLIQLKIDAGGVGTIKGDTFFHNITFTPGYLPILKISTPEKTCDFVNPGETKDFDIGLENLGNAKTNVTAEVLNIPEGWTVSILSNTILGTKTTDGKTKKTISLIVRPSDSLGYHNDNEVIRVKFIPLFFGNSSINGSEYLVSFIVKSRGFSAPGFDAVSVLAMFALFAVALIVKKRKLRRKNK